MSSNIPKTILAATIATLGKIGTPHSIAFLEKMASTRATHAEAARKAALNIQQRYARQQPDAPSTS